MSFRPKLPPPELRYKVNGDTDEDSFLEAGQIAALDLETAIKRYNKIGLAGTVLDFGCGCGRITQWLMHRNPNAAFVGSDFDVEAIYWCRDNISPAFAINQRLPPMSDYFRDGMFDCVLAVSVFTHINKQMHDAWLPELARIVKPGGLCIVTTHGDGIWSRLYGAHNAKDLTAAGYIWMHEPIWRNLFPDWYGNAFHSAEYVRTEFAKCFDVIDVLPLALMNNQDIVILRGRG